MKIILLRHEERGINCGFFSELTNEGILGSLKLSKKLNKLNINEIYCSPFIRTLQTIFPYSYKYNVKINVEYGLTEYLHNPYFLIDGFHSIKDINDKDLIEIINMNYTSICNIEDDLIILEDENNLEKRLLKFLSYLKLKYNTDTNNINNTVLLVTHKGIINKIKQMLLLNINMDDDFKMGHYEIYDLF